MVDGERKWCRCGRYPYVTREADGSWRCGYCKAVNDAPPEYYEELKERRRALEADRVALNADRQARMEEKYGPKWESFLEVKDKLKEVEDYLDEAAGRPWKRSKEEALNLGSYRNRQAAEMLRKLTEDRSHVLWKRLYELQERGRNLREHIKK